jgi:hypothetical protein
MSAGWESDKSWSDQFLPELKRILGEHLIGEPPVVEDQKRNTDLIVLHMDAVRIAARVRNFYALERWPNEFTIRAGRPSGAKTELAKIIEGWGDYLIYAFVAQDNSRLAAWHLLDLSGFRLWHSRYMATHKGSQPGKPQKNTDGSSDFRAFSLYELPPDLIVARKTQPKVAA